MISVQFVSLEIIGVAALEVEANDVLRARLFSIERPVAGKLFARFFTSFSISDL